MKRVAIVTDSNSGITRAEARKLGIGWLPMPVTVDGEPFLEEVSISQKEFFKKLAADAEVSSSQPSPGELTGLWDEVLRTSDELVYIPMSSGLSGSCATAGVLAGDYDGRVVVVDNQRISVTMRQSVLDAVKLRNLEYSAAEIGEILRREGMESSIYVSVNTLKYLKKSGRVTAAGAALGCVLNLKPVLTIQGGKLDAFRKVRGMNAAMDVMLDAVYDDIHNRFSGEMVALRAAYSGDLESGRRWQTRVREKFGDRNIGLDALPISISCHVGEGALGIGVARCPEELK